VYTKHQTYALSRDRDDFIEIASSLVQ